MAKRDSKAHGNPAQGQPVSGRNGRRYAWIIGVIAIALVLLALLLRFALQPERVARLLLDRVGTALGLEITASGIGEYRLRGTPALVLRDVVAREPGAATPLLRAGRIYLSLPWSTIRAAGDKLEITRVELDAPILDLPALQHWLVTRPQRETRIPTLTDGLHVTDGRIDNDDWRIDGIKVDVPRMAPGQPLTARISGRYMDPPTAIPFDFAVALTRPDNDSGLGLVGRMTIQRDSWRMPAHVRLSGPLHLGDDDLRIQPARLAMSAQYESGEDPDTTMLPFALGLSGPLHFDDATWTLAPVGVALRSRGPSLPDLDARGALALGRRLVLQLDGTLAAWPAAWPTLPPPLGDSESSLPFALHYLDKPDFSGTTTLRLHRDATRFDARFHAFDVTAWIDGREQASPLPPLDGHVTAPSLEVAGAQLQGVEISIDDPALPNLDQDR